MVAETVGHVAKGYRGRLAPSPTGAMHLGNARTALVAWLRARSEGGSLVVRMEDLDGPRVRQGAAERLLADLRWLGLDWDEGPDRGGPVGPYLQSQRTAWYEAAWRRLLEAGRLYRCTCSRRELAQAASAPHGLEPRYPGTCRAGPRRPDRAGAWRFRMPASPPSFMDAVHGRVSGRADDDFVVRRADGLFAYQLAVVVDDGAMGIGEVVRGDDLLASTPRQIALYQALGMPVPRFLHVPLVLGEDGERLAKRHGAISVAEHRDAGVSARALVGALAASLGLVPAGTSCAPRALLADFDAGKLSTRPVRWQRSNLPL